MRAIAALVCTAALLAASAVVVAESGLFTVRQNAQGAAQVVTISPADGSFAAKSALAFSFPFPLVETTVDPVNGLAYMVTYVGSGAGGASLYQLNGRSSTLDTVQLWTNATQDFFDLQYDTAQQTLYGIGVVSQYGRTLSNITLTTNPNTVSINHLVAMPMDWYVNASSFDPQTSRYFALLNNFPSLPNATIAQKFVVADFSQPPVPPNPSPDTIYELNDAGAVIWHFVGWSASEEVVYGLATAASQLQPDALSTWLTSIDPATGEQQMVMAVETLETGPTFPGPLMIDPNTGDIYAYVMSVATGGWSLVSLSGGVNVVQSYGAEWAFRAATFAAW